MTVYDLSYISVDIKIIIIKNENDCIGVFNWYFEPKMTEITKPEQNICMSKYHDDK